MIPSLIMSNLRNIYNDCTCNSWIIPLSYYFLVKSTNTWSLSWCNETLDSTWIIVVSSVLSYNVFFKLRISSSDFIILELSLLLQIGFCLCHYSLRYKFTKLFILENMVSPLISFLLYFYLNKQFIHLIGLFLYPLWWLIISSIGGWNLVVMQAKSFCKIYIWTLVKLKSNRSKAFSFKSFIQN